MKNIIIDIDDVTLKWTKGFSAFIGKDLTVEDRTIANCLGIEHYDANKIVKDFNMSPHFGNLEFVADAIESIQKLKENYNVYFVTACGTDVETLYYRQKNLAPLTQDSEILFLNLHESKERAIKLLNPVLFVDDSYKYVKEARAYGATTFLFDTPWARLSGEQTYVWKDIINEHFNLV